MGDFDPDRNVGLYPGDDESVLPSVAAFSSAPLLFPRVTPKAAPTAPPTSRKMTANIPHFFFRDMPTPLSFALLVAKATSSSSTPAS